MSRLVLHAPRSDGIANVSALEFDLSVVTHDRVGFLRRRKPDSPGKDSQTVIKSIWSNDSRRALMDRRRCCS